ncbi:TIGR01777 family oxidoreductase [Flavobacterium capsici]|uniref:TIGR01777 family oxidoreductase n=1 Tax=Flavobacterium capsici TaxID=3075618 RepID=A0AA96F0W9_9FLAO|nr:MULTISPECIES: TIGR01777 family oxidoreductase [unclassified Flavobacterium]WNM17793.1 TIGR01777 family oxidoreductase [Flavobacterium sp. PMR2A8]WNM21846.1 TIGR01777 family oxidoreductase [Flavobacterium sp. PMTSA4]
MKLLITGATGFIGTALVKKLNQKGHIIHYLTTSKDKLENSENYKGFYWNPDTKEIDVSCFDGVEAIIHLAGANIAKRWTRNYRKEIISSRTETSSLLLTSLKEINHQIKHIISASGTAIYPESYDRVYDENDSETADDFLAKVVKVWENGISNFEYLGLKVAKIRTGVVYGKNGGAFQEIVKPIKFGFGAVMGNGKQVQSWIHLNDLVNLYCFVLENNLEGIYNAVAPETISNKDQTKAIAKKLHKPLFLPNIPRFMMKFILGEMSLLLFTSKKLSSKKIQEKGFQFKYPNFDSALNELL